MSDSNEAHNTWDFGEGPSSWVVCTHTHAHTHAQEWSIVRMGIRADLSLLCSSCCNHHSHLPGSCFINDALCNNRLWGSEERTKAAQHATEREFSPIMMETVKQSSSSNWVHWHPTSSACKSLLSGLALPHQFTTVSHTLQQEEAPNAIVWSNSKLENCKLSRKPCRNQLSFPSERTSPAVFGMWLWAFLTILCTVMHSFLLSTIMMIVRSTPKLAFQLLAL